VPHDLTTSLLPAKQHASGQHPHDMMRRQSAAEAKGHSRTYSISTVSVFFLARSVLAEYDRTIGPKMPPIRVDAVLQQRRVPALGGLRTGFNGPATTGKLPATISSCLKTHGGMAASGHTTRGAGQTWDHDSLGVQRARFATSTPTAACSHRDQQQLPWPTSAKWNESTPAASDGRMDSDCSNRSTRPSNTVPQPDRL
jgi:hypothetical protein